MGPYREAVATEVLEAPAREGLARLELGPRFFRLSVGERLSLAVNERFATLIRVPRRRRRREKKRSIGLDGGRLIMARGVPTDDIGLWHEPQPGLVERLVGLRPPELLDEAALGAWQSVDRMAQRLDNALGPYRHGVRRAIEVGQGADRVLVTDLDDCLVFYVRRLFRERARQAMQVYRDGTVLLAGKNGEQRLQVRSRYGVTAFGDYVRFADPTGADLGALSVPWISTEERRYLVQLVGQVVDQGPAMPARAKLDGAR
ncbi:hypothetical protein [Haliangium sp.]|uniref:hypothetical protein n=1 Tax=Haliangium sp. TaxID=2663208 RepID=UPI003D148B07